MFTAPCLYNAYAYDAEFDASFHDESFFFFKSGVFGVAGIWTGEKFQGLWFSIFIFSHLACRRRITDLLECTVSWMHGKVEGKSITISKSDGV